MSQMCNNNHPWLSRMVLGPQVLLLLLLLFFKNINHFLKSLLKEMAVHSGILAWEIPWTEESGGLQSRGSQRDGQDLVTKQKSNNWICYNIAPVFYVLVFWPWSMWDLSSLTGIKPILLHWRWSLNYWQPGSPAS